MTPSYVSQSSKPLSGRYLAFAEREEIAILRVQEHGVSILSLATARPSGARLECAPLGVAASRFTQNDFGYKALETIYSEIKQNFPNTNKQNHHLLETHLLHEIERT